MIERLLFLAVRFRWVVVFLTVLVAGFGAWHLARLPIDAVPDITTKQVQINTLAPAFGPLDMERLVTFPVETAMAGIPGLEGTRSISRNGFSQVTVTFEEDVDIYFARQQVAERLTQARESLPDGAEPRMGPISTGLGEVLMYVVEYEPLEADRAKVADGQPGWQSDGSYLTPEGERLTDEVSRLAYLRTLQDWFVSPHLRTVPGIAGIDTIGGYEKQYVVKPDPARMAAYGLSFSDLVEALEQANLSVGANYVQRGGEAFLVRADARIRSLDEIARAVVANRGGVPVTVRDVATVRLGGDLRTGAASENGQEVVVGTVLMLAGENSRAVAQSASERLGEIARSMPPSVKIKEVLNRSKLVNATISTVQKNLTEGALLVITVLFLLLGNIRAAIITALVIPLSLLMTAIGMNELGVSGNLMSLGALDFGLIVDGAVIIVENALRRLAERQHREGRLLSLSEHLEETTAAAKEMIQPTVYGQAIIFLVFVPLLTFTGTEGKMFSPMAITLMLALAGAFVLSLTFVPAMVAIFVRGKVAEKEAKVIQVAKRRYEPLLGRALARPWPFIGGGLAVFALAALLFGTLGREFIPTLDEKDLTVQSIRIPSTSLDQSMAMQKQVEQAVSSLPEVAFVFSKTGTAEVATDPMPPNISDSFIILKPEDQWPADTKSKADVIEKIEARIGGLVGNNYEFSQPIQMRFNELIGGVRGDVAVKIYGDDLDALGEAAARVAQALQTVEGTEDLRIEQTAGFPTLNVQFDRAAIARYGLSVQDVAETVAVALGGREAGLVFEGDRRFDVVVRLPNAARDDLDAIGALPVMLSESGAGPRVSVPLHELVRFSYSEGLNQVSRENGKRRVVVQANIRGRDLGSYVAEAKDQVGTVPLPAGAYVEWGGQFENLTAAQARLSVVVPVVFILILVLLYGALRSWKLAAVVYSAVPMALAGGVFALWLRGLPFSISAAVGFIALSGVAVLNGLVMMSSIQKRLDAGLDVDGAIRDGALERLRPVLMTALVASLGFVPMAVATGTGAEVQRPLATVVIGGLITATLLTLLVLPAISHLVLKSDKRRTQRRPGDVQVPETAQ